MKLRNKKTGLIADAHEIVLISGCLYLKIFSAGDYDTKQYASLAEFNEEWEDYEEPKEHWAIDQFGEPINVTGLSRLQLEKLHRCGNDFPSKNATIEAVEKLKALKRLKDKGFKFEGWEDSSSEDDFDMIFFTMKARVWDIETQEALDLLFGGEE